MEQQENEPTWVEILPGRHWSSWQSAYHRGLVLGGSGVTFIGTLATGHVVARTYTGQEWLLVGAS